MARSPAGMQGHDPRQEVYEIDVEPWKPDDTSGQAISAACHNCRIRRLQPRDNRHAVFLVTEAEALTYHYELDLKEKTLRPDPRIAHALTLSTNEYGQALQAVAVGYPRVRAFRDDEAALPPGTEALIRQVQNELHLSYTETRYTNDVDLDDHYRLRVPCEVSTFELTGIRPQDEEDRSTSDPWDDVYFTLDELRAFRLSEEDQKDGLPVQLLPVSPTAGPHRSQKRIVEQVRTLYFDEDLTDSLSYGALNHLGLLYETYKLALTNELLDAILKQRLEEVREGSEEYEATVGRSCVPEDTIGGTAGGGSAPALPGLR